MDALIGSNFIVRNPTDELRQWCAEHLVIDNPDYIKLTRMKKWTGNTPRYLQLYVRYGATNETPEMLVLPFGCSDLLRQFPMPFKVLISPLRAVQYHPDIKLYPYQEEAVEAALKYKNGILVMPCGAGKTITGLSVIARIGGRALWLTHTQDLLNQSLDKAKSIFNDDVKSYGIITAGKVNVGSSITFATIQTLAKVDLSDLKDAFDIIVVDECIPANTLIDTPNGKKAIQDLCIDDIVTSYNRDSGALEDKRVTHVFKSKAHDIVKVNLSNGKSIVCTANHPVFTQNREWIEAGGLNCNDYVLRLVRDGSGYKQNAVNYKVQNIKKRLLLLFKKMFCARCAHTGCVDRRTQEKSGRNYGFYKSKVCKRTNEKEQSYEEARGSGKSVNAFERNRASSKDQMRKWSGLDSASTDFNDCSCRQWVECLCGVPDSNKDEKKFGISNLLQSGHWDSKSNDCGRNGWKFSLLRKKESTGQEKGFFFEWVRVESVEIQKQTSDGTFGRLCTDGYVYNIEVEDNNNYFANGVLVHNCHHACGSPTRVTQFYKVLNAFSARYKFGLTATPKRADGLELSMFTLLGKVIHTVHKDAVENTTCPVVYRPIETGYFPNSDAVLAGDGTLNYAALIDDLIHDQQRFDCVANVLESLDGSVIVLGNRVEYLQRLCDNYSGRAICLSALGTSKAAKAMRKSTLQKLNDGELDAVFCTYQLAAEGLDVPNLKYVVLATPEKDPTRIQQTTGRVGRKAENKTVGTVIDFVDNFGMYKGWYKKRLSVYKKLGYGIIE